MRAGVVLAFFLPNILMRMLTEIITIGDEILIGQIVDTNSAWMAQELNAIGVKVHQITSVSDSPAHILEALAAAEKSVSLVLITGGLGPTKDDLTKKTLAEYFGSEMHLDEDVLAHLSVILAHRGLRMLELNRDQAIVPDCCEVLLNKVGTAPGMWFERGGVVFVSMPGVPNEMKWLITEKVLPRVVSHFSRPAIVHKTILTYGLPESALADRISAWEDALPSYVKLAYLPGGGAIRLRLSANGDSGEVISAELERLTDGLKLLIPELIFGYGKDTMELVVGRLLRAKNAHLATAESCTGGRIAHLITSVPGSSEYFVGSVVAYHNRIKENVLGVDNELLTTHGAVSEEVVLAMAANVCKLMGAEYSVAVSGIAGPGGGTDLKPVGTVWIAVAGPEFCVAKHFVFSNIRERNIHWASMAALNLLRLQLIAEH
jgi:nicotinamide-nucleotide amidase